MGFIGGSSSTSRMESPPVDGMPYSRGVDEAVVHLGAAVGGEGLAPGCLGTERSADIGPASYPLSFPMNAFTASTTMSRCLP